MARDDENHSKNIKVPKATPSEPSYDLKRIARAQDFRGFHENCDGCPVRLACLGDMPTGVYCFSCGHYYLGVIGVMLHCDALHNYRWSRLTSVLNTSDGACSDASEHASGDVYLPTGTCPVCDNGQPKEMFIYYEGVCLNEK